MLLEVWPVFSFLKAQKQTAAVSDDVMDKGVSALDLVAEADAFPLFGTFQLQTWAEAEPELKKGPFVPCAL